VIEDLLGAGQRDERCDVVVVGAGTVGLVIATSLARLGLAVVCLESGARHQDGEQHELNEVVHTRSVYAGAQHGRFRCLGGTSTRWGGALIPFLSRDLSDAGWPIGLEDVSAFRAAVESLFSLPGGGYEAPDLLGCADLPHIARLAKWPPFKKRNVYRLLAADVAAAHGPKIILNATATEFHVESERLRSVRAFAADGSRIEIGARSVVFAAGAIETTRLLLLLDRQNDRCLRRQNDHLGRFFHDHLSVPVATLEVADRALLNRLLGFRFVRNGAMRNLRFELSESGTARDLAPRGFAHVTFETAVPTGFDALRDLLRLLQQGKPPPARLLFRLLAAAPWLVRAVWWRFIEKRLLYPDGAQVRVHMVIEQTPRPENRITLSPDRVDRFGQPLAQLEWSVFPEDAQAIDRAVDAFEVTWNRSVLATAARFIRRPRTQVGGDLSLGSGIYHPGGTTRLGHSAGDGVVDSRLRVFGLPNVRVVSTSVLPTGGGTNPTMMLLMLGLRCVDDLAAELGAKFSKSGPGRSAP
jgi:choline dehydrogenase-like flavoprotein